MFVRNAWYAAAWEREIGEQPFAATVAGEQVAIFRRSDGSYAALHDACAHRKLPLSMGRVRGDVVECGYHGMCFDGTGGCVAAPTNGTVPAHAAVAAFSVEARYGLVWLWLGDPTLADPHTIFEVRHWDEAGWGRTQGDDMVVRCHHLLIADNLLDPSHVAWVHPGSFAGQGTDDTPMETTIGDGGVTVWRWLLDAPAPPFYAPYLPFSGPCDRKQQYEVRYPSNALVTAVFTPAGAGGEWRSLPPETFVMDSYNFVTPIDEHTTRYFWFQLRNVAADDDAVSRAFAASVKDAFAEDKIILEAVQRGLDTAAAPTVNLRSDAGGVRFRRRHAQLVQAEQG